MIMIIFSDHVAQPDGRPVTGYQYLELVKIRQLISFGIDLPVIGISCHMQFPIRNILIDHPGIQSDTPAFGIDTENL